MTFFKQTSSLWANGYRCGKISLLGCLMGVMMMGAGCTEVKKTLGLERDPPDEFSVVPRAEISLPPDFNLMPPQASSVPRGDVLGGPDKRSQEMTPQLKAKNALFGGNPKEQIKTKAPLSKGEKGFMNALVPYQKAGDQEARDIRRVLDEETGVNTTTDKTWVQKLLSWQKTDRNKEAIDPRAEHQKIYGTQPDGTIISENTD